MPSEAEITWFKDKGFSAWDDLTEEQKTEARQQLSLKGTDEELNQVLWRRFRDRWECVDIDQVKKAMGTFLGPIGSAL